MNKYVKEDVLNLGYTGHNNHRHIYYLNILYIRKQFWHLSVAIYYSVKLSKNSRNEHIVLMQQK